MPTYNYDHFRSSHFDFTAFSGPRRGDPMPDVVLRTLGGDTRSLSDYLGRTLVIETGSVTCPMYAKGVPDMADLAARHPDVAFVVLYVREAHPGERIGPHVDADAKRAAARLVESELGDCREVLIDDLDGTAHRVLGGFPNMVYIVDHRGLVVFRGDWVDVDAVSAVLDDSADDALLDTQHFPPAKPDPRTAVRTLLKGGYRALLEFGIGLPGLIRMHHRADRHYSRTAQPTVEPS
jgi:hypothetical protein